MTRASEDNDEAETLRAMFAGGVLLPLDGAIEADDAMERLQLPLMLW